MIAASFMSDLEDAYGWPKGWPDIKLELSELEIVVGLPGLFECRRLQGRHEIETLSRFASPRA
jgi:hypothetical protein